MKLTQYNRFYSLFKYLHEVVFTIGVGKTESNDNLTIELRNNIQQIMIDTNEFENISFDDIMNEFKLNLYTLTKENKDSFIIGLLQQWAQFAPYFDIRNEREFYLIEGIVVNTNTEFYNTARNTIKKNERIPVYLKDSIFEKYIFLCYLKKNQFFKLLSDFCYLLDIDFNKLQIKVATPPENAKHDESEKTITEKNQDDKTVFDELLMHIKFDKDKKTKTLVKGYLFQLKANTYFNDSNDKDFATIAVIFYQSGWLTNIKSFKKWKSLFSIAFGRKNSTYKPNKLEENTESIKRKIPFLDEIPVGVKK